MLGIPSDKKKEHIDLLMQLTVCNTLHMKQTAEGLCLNFNFGTKLNIQC